MSDIQSGPSPSREAPPHVLIVGGGVAGVEAALALGESAGERVQLTLVCDRARFLLRPQLLGEPWGAPPLRVELRRLTDELGAELCTGTLTGIDVDARRAQLSDGTELAYDEVLVATGARSSLPYPYVMTIGFGPLPASLADGTTGEVAIVVPPGTGWTLPAHQLALLTAVRSRHRVRVLTPEATPLESFGATASARVAELLAAAGVEVCTERTVEPGSDLAELADIVVALPLQHGMHLHGLPNDSRGELVVDERMRVRGTPGVHAAGDVTAGRLKQGGLASQQAECAAHDILASVLGEAAPAPAVPVLRGIIEVPDGPRVHLERRLDGSDAGRWSAAPLTALAAPLCAPRTVRWLASQCEHPGPEPYDVVAAATAFNARSTA